MKYKALYFSNPVATPEEITIQILELDFQLIDPTGKINNWPIFETEMKFLEGTRKLIFTHSSYQNQSILVENLTDSESILKIWPNKSSLPIAPKGLWTIGGLILAVIALVVIGLVVVFWKASPILADQLAKKIPVEWENETGQKMLESVLSSQKIDTQRTQLIQDFYSRLEPLSTTHSEKLPPISITVIENPEFNAFAIPGRSIVVYSGVFQHLTSYDELMALIGHEAGHVEFRHSLRSLVRSGALYMVFSLVFGDLSGLSAILVDNAQSLQSLSYSRDFEREADLASHDFLCLNAANISATRNLMQLMNRLQGENGKEIPSFMQSHPLTEERIENAEKELNKSSCRLPPIVKPVLDSLFQRMKSQSTK